MEWKLQQIIFLVILASALVLFISERVRVDIAAMLTLLALAFTGILTPDEALAGFASEPAIIIASVFVISAALSATGVTDRIGVLISRAAGASEWRAILVVMPAVALLAAFSHHVMVTAMMLPIVLKLSREQKLPASRLLMPMSLAASLGTTLTLFSAPAFLLANNLLESTDRKGLGVFAISPIGAALVGLGIVYMSLGRWLLPRHQGRTEEADYMRLDRYYTELIIEPDSPWSGKPITEFQTRFEERFSIVEWLRGGQRHRDTGAHATLAAGDVLIVRAAPEELASIDKEPGLALHALKKYGEASPTEEGGAADPADERQLVQVVVAPHSPFAGRTIGHIDFLRTLGVVVVGLWRRDGWMREEISQLRLREGDLLVLWGSPHTFAEITDHPGFLMMVPFTPKEHRRHRAMVAVGIGAAVVAAAASGIVPTQLAFLAGAVAMVLTGCVSIGQAYREIDVRIFVMIAGVIPLGAAMEKTGTAALLADHLQGVVSGWSPFAVLLVLFWAAALLTQILSDAATTVLLGPIALAIAVALGLPPQPFVVLHGARRSGRVPHADRPSRQPAHPERGSIHVRGLPARRCPPDGAEQSRLRGARRAALAELRKPGQVDRSSGTGSLHAPLLSAGPPERACIMLLNAKILNALNVAASDAPAGEVKDSYFDDVRWTVRYLVVDTRAWLRGREVLISPVAVTHIDLERQRIDLSVTQKQVDESPSIETDKPVSRMMEAHLNRYYGYPDYWAFGANAPVWGWGDLPILPPSISVPATPLDSGRSGHAPAQLARSDGLSHQGARRDVRSRRGSGRRPGQLGDALPDHRHAQLVAGSASAARGGVGERDRLVDAHVVGRHGCGAHQGVPAVRSGRAGHARVRGGDPSALRAGDVLALEELRDPESRPVLTSGRVVI